VAAAEPDPAPWASFADPAIQWPWATIAAFVAAGVAIGVANAQARERRRQLRQEVIINFDTASSEWISAVAEYFGWRPRHHNATGGGVQSPFSLDRMGPASGATPKWTELS
jgi:hypothetical protein